MKISDVKGERSFTIIKDVVPYIEKLSRNQFFKSFMDRKNLPENYDEAQEAMLKRITDNVPGLIASAKDDIAAYLALLEGVPVEEFIKNADAEKLITSVTEMVNDKCFLTFFMPFLNQHSKG